MRKLQNRNALIKIAFQNPVLRKELLPVILKIAEASFDRMEEWEEQHQKLMALHKKIDSARKKKNNRSLAESRRTRSTRQFKKFYEFAVRHDDYEEYKTLQMEFADLDKARMEADLPYAKKRKRELTRQLGSGTSSLKERMRVHFRQLQDARKDVEHADQTFESQLEKAIAKLEKNAQKNPDKWGPRLEELKKLKEGGRKDFEMPSWIGGNRTGFWRGVSEKLKTSVEAERSLEGTLSSGVHKYFTTMQDLVEFSDQTVNQDKTKKKKKKEQEREEKKQSKVRKKKHQKAVKALRRKLDQRLGVLEKLKESSEDLGSLEEQIESLKTLVEEHEGKESVTEAELEGLSEQSTSLLGDIKKGISKQKRQLKKKNKTDVEKKKESLLKEWGKKLEEAQSEDASEKEQKVIKFLEEHIQTLKDQKSLGMKDLESWESISNDADKVITNERDYRENEGTREEEYQKKKKELKDRLKKRKEERENEESGEESSKENEEESKGMSDADREKLLTETVTNPETGKKIQIKNLQSQPDKTPQQKGILQRFWEGVKNMFSKKKASKQHFATAVIVKKARTLPPAEVIKFAYHNPEFREHLLPIIRKSLNE